MPISTAKATGYIYLLLVPLLAIVLGFGVGHVSYMLYLPVWLLNALLMVYASWSVGLHVIRLKKDEKSSFAKAAFLLICPWIIISLFAGLGPPPETATEWTATAKEQQARYFLLVISGVFIGFGFSVLRERLKETGENFYSLIGLTAISIALPLFIINMLYWGFYLTELFRMQAIENTTTLPDWFQPTRQLFRAIAVIEVALTYLATFAFVVALRKTGWLSKRASFFYLLFSLVAFVIIILSAFFRETFSVPAYAVSIPAIPFLMPYFMGVNLLRKAGNTSEKDHRN